MKKIIKIFMNKNRIGILKRAQKFNANNIKIVPTNQDCINVAIQQLKDNEFEPIRYRKGNEIIEIQ